MARTLVVLSVVCLTFELANAILRTTVNVSSAGVSWNDGIRNPECHLLGREFINTTSLEDIRVRGVSSGKDVYWIGAHIQYTKWIRLFGCYNIQILDITSSHSSQGVVDCYQRCQGTSFVLSTERCMCLDTYRIDTNDDCRATPCPGHSDEFCGTDEIVFDPRRFCLCVYDIIDLPSHNEIGNCKIISSLSLFSIESLETRDCSEEHSYLCEDDLFSEDRRPLNWSAAGFACHRDQKRQFYNGIDGRRYLGRYGRYWVGVFRKEIPTWGNKTPHGTEFDCLAASVSTEGKLSPSVRKCYNKLPLLCAQPDKEQVENKVEIEKNDSLPRNKVVCQGPNAMEPETFDVLSLLVGAGCGILFTIMILILSMVIYKCRKKTTNVPTPQNGQQDVGSTDTLGVHYEHLRSGEGCNVYDVCGQSSVSYDYITTQK